MKILVISEIIPKPDFSSGDRRFLGILKILASKHDVSFCIPNHQPWLKPEETKKYINHIKSLNIRFLPLNESWFGKTIKEESYDIGFFEFFWAAEKYMISFIKHQPRAVVIVDSVDFHFAREETQYKLGQISRRKVKRTKKRECAVYHLADITIAVSKQDRDHLVEKEGVENVSLIPNVVSTVKRIDKVREPSLLFIGCYAWPPNVDGMLWFTKEIWPLVLAKKKDVKLLIVGSQPTKEIKELATMQGVQVKGYVPETTPFLESAALSIAPLRYGGGMKGKVNEALAFGLPVVSTSIGAQGFEAENGVHMFIADSPEDFADAVLKLLNNVDLQKKMGLAGQQLNEKLCSPALVEKNIDELLKMCNDLRNKPKVHPKFQYILKVRINNFLQQNLWRFVD
ncbi:MAG: glycosyltransferase family 4 protein [Bacteroidales bacterium]|nr:glycosyltransferase family 4 protein [Bacteroidales bacterium]